MTTYAADDVNTIAKRLAEIEAEKLVRVTGEKLPEVAEVAFGWAYNPADYDPACSTNLRN